MREVTRVGLRSPRLQAMLHRLPDAALAALQAAVALGAHCFDTTDAVHLVLAYHAKVAGPARAAATAALAASGWSLDPGGYLARFAPRGAAEGADRGSAP